MKTQPSNVFLCSSCGSNQTWIFFEPHEAYKENASKISLIHMGVASHEIPISPYASNNTLVFFSKRQVFNIAEVNRPTSNPTHTPSAPQSKMNEKI